MLATVARREGLDLLPLTGRYQHAFLEFARPLMDAMLATVEAAYGLPADPGFAEDRVRAFCEAPDSATRVLAGRYLRADLRPYFERLNTRLGEAAQTAHDNKTDVAPFLAAYEEIEAAIRDSGSFLDVSSVDPKTGRLVLSPTPPRVDQAIDEEARDLLEAGLRGWAPTSAANRIVRRVARSLSTWY